MLLSKPSTKISSQYDVIVIGSGYGGGVAASRFSRSGKKVAVLEKGMEFKAENFAAASALSGITTTEMHIKNRTFGPKTSASWEFTVSDDIAILVGRGLGGGSLINAAVMVIPEPRVFQDERWPESVRKDFSSGKMMKYYKRARDMLNVAPYPTLDAPRTGKVELFEKAAKVAGLGDRLVKPDLAVSFHATGSNHVGVPQAATDFSGDFIQGNRSGAKNDTTKNYLPDAIKHGAEIYCGIEVQYIKENTRTGDYVVFFKDASQSHNKEIAVRAATVVLAAGTLGTAGIMLRSKKEGLDLNENVGKRFSGNGATVALLNAGSDEEAVRLIPTGTGDTAGQLGVYIDTILDMRNDDAKFLEDNVLIEDCVWQQSLGPPQLDFNQIPTNWKDMQKAMINLIENKTPTLPLMCLGHDDADAEIIMSEGDNPYPTVRWKSTEKEDRTRQAQRKAFQALADSLGGTFSELPAGLRPLSKRCTAHPLGGCVMSDDPSNGLINDRGHVYRADGTAHQGLMIVDGSSFPTSVGCNPALTITALAERAVDLHIQDEGSRFTVAQERNGLSTILAGLLRPAGPDVEFSERMSGHMLICGRWVEDAQQANAGGKTTNSPFEFSVKITIDDLELFMEHDEDANIIGTVTAPSISPHPLTITSGRMRLFVPNEDDIFSHQMQYDLPMDTRDGRRFMLVGFKNMSDDHGVNCIGSCGQAYHDTTRLQFVLYEENQKGKILGRGLLFISFPDCVKMILTMHGKKANQFKNYFLKNLSTIYLRALLPKKTPAITDELLPLQRQLNAPRRVAYLIPTADGEELPVKRFQGGNRGVIVCSHGLTTTDLMYTVETIKKNFVEAMCEKGYDVWTVNLRFGRLARAKKNFSLDDVAKYDYPAIFDFIEKKTDPSSRRGGIHMHGQCFGSMTFCMAVLGGYIAPERVKSLVCSQLAFNMRLSPLNGFKMSLGLPSILGCMGIQKYRGPRDPERSVSDKCLDWFASYVLPIPSSFRTNNVEHARIALLFSELWAPSTVNRLTIERMVPDIGPMHVRLLKHVAAVCKAGKAVNEKGEDVYIPNLQKLAMIPTTFQFGTASGVFQKEAMVLDLQALETEASKRGYVASQGQSIHKLVLAEGYGHLDCLIAKDAYEKLYPDIINHFETWDKLETRPWNNSTILNTETNGSKKARTMSAPAHKLKLTMQEGGL